MIYRLEFNSIPPSKKNSKEIGFINRGGKKLPLIYNSKSYKKWHKETRLEILSQKRPSLDKCSSVSIIFHDKYKRKWDLTNKAESVMDLLVDMGIIKDDNWNIVPSVRLERVVSKENKTEIILFE